MNEMNLVRDEKAIAYEINFIKRRTFKEVLSASVEIGKLLCEAKLTVASGEWMSWLEENVNYSQSTANNLMRLYKEYGEQSQIGFFEENRLEIFGDITPSQALALVALPYPERKEFVQSHDMESTSVRDIEAEIKARKEAEERATEAENEKTELSEKVAELEKELEETRREAIAVDEENDRLNGQLVDVEKQARLELEKEYEGKLKAAEKEAASKAKAKVDKLKEELAGKDAEFEKRLSEETEKAKTEAHTEAEELYKSKVEALNAEIGTLKSKVTSMNDSSVQKFAVHFELFQKEGQLLLKLLSDVADADTAAKLKLGFETVIDSFKEALK